MATDDLKKAFDAIKKKNPKYTALYGYYQGNHPLRYSTERLQKAFEDMDVYFSQNWLAVVIDAVLDRLIMKGFDVSGKASSGKQHNERLDQIWKDYHLQLVAEDIHESVSVTGEGFLIAMRSDADDDMPLDIYHNDSRMCHIFYEPDRPLVKRMAAKIWRGEDGHAKMALYYKDRFEYYKSNTKTEGSDLVASYASFVPDEDMPSEDNPFPGTIPVFRFTSGGKMSRNDLGKSEISLQDAINKLLTDMLVSAEFNAFVQRVIISQTDPGNLQNISGANWWIPAGDGKGQQSSVFELGGRDLNGFLSAIDKLATSMAIISRTPKHYFFGQGGDPSGEALYAMEAPLNKKVQKRQERLSVEWQSLGAFLLMLDGGEAVKKSDIIPLWEPAQTSQMKTDAETIKIERESGIPLITALRRHGWSNDELQQLAEDVAEERKTMLSLAQIELEKIRAREDQENSDPTERAPSIDDQENDQ